MPYVLKSRVVILTLLFYAYIIPHASCLRSEGKRHKRGGYFSVDYYKPSGEEGPILIDNLFYIV